MTYQTFSERPFEQRIGQLGDQAEAVFEAVYPQGWARYGLCRPPINLATVPPMIRYSPDYITAKGFVEVQGFGRDQTFKLKASKYEALNAWHGLFRVDLFAYDSHNKRYGFMRLHDWFVAAEEHGWNGAFDNGANPFIALHADHLPVDSWREYTTA